MHAAHAAAPRRGRYKDRSVRAGIWSQAGPCQRCSFSHKEANGPALGKRGASLTLASGPALFLPRPRRDGWGRQFCDASLAERNKTPYLEIPNYQPQTQPTQPLQVRTFNSVGKGLRGTSVTPSSSQRLRRTVAGGESLGRVDEKGARSWNRTQ